MFIIMRDRRPVSSSVPCLFFHFRSHTNEEKVNIDPVWNQWGNTLHTSLNTSHLSPHITGTVQIKKPVIQNIKRLWQALPHHSNKVSRKYITSPYIVLLLERLSEAHVYQQLLLKGEQAVGLELGQI